MVWGGSSADKVLTFQVGELEFDFQNSPKMPGMVVHAHNPNPGGVETDKSLDMSDPSSLA